MWNVIYYRHWQQQRITFIDGSAEDYVMNEIRLWGPKYIQFIISFWKSLEKIQLFK